MDHSFLPPRTSLAGMLGRSSLSDEELAALRSKAWRRQGLLIVSPSDPRLNFCEANMVRRVAERLYGEDSS